MLLPYRAVITRAGALLLGLVTGVLLVGAIAVTVPGWVGRQPPTSDVTAIASRSPTPAVSPTTPSRSTAPRPPLTTPPTTAAPASTTEPATTEPAPTPTTGPAPTPRAAPAPAPAAAVVAATNVERRNAGCPAVQTDARLTAAAQAHASDMAEHGYFSHVSLDGREFNDRVGATGHPSPGGENIARGQDGAAEVVAAWMNSPSHRRVIEECSFTGIGVGFDARGNYWVQNFGR